MLAGDGLDIRKRLLDEGVDINNNRKAREKMLEYIQTVKPFKKVTCVTRIGWYGNSFILPDHIIPQNNNLVLQTENHNNYNTFKTKGTLAEWQNNVVKYTEGNSRLIFALSAAFAAPLLKLTNGESGIFHLVGRSSTGKSTTLKIAASVWGGGGNNGFIKQWRSTDNAQEAIAAEHSDCLLPLDELGQACGKTVGDTAYMLANNKGKQRMNSLLL